MELPNKNINRCIRANESHRNGPLIKFLATKVKEHLRSLFVAIDICGSYCELMTLNTREVNSDQCDRHRNGKCTELTRCEYAVHDKMVANRERSGENSYVYFVNSSGKKTTSHCIRGHKNRTNGNGGGGGGGGGVSKSKIRHFIRGHSVSVLILVIFSLGFIDMVNGKSFVSE